MLELCHIENLTAPLATTGINRHFTRRCISAAAFGAMDPLKGQRTHFPKRAELAHNWVLVDAKDMILGRVSTKIASLLMGKNKRNYQPGQLVGDHVVVINAAQVKLSANKAARKEYVWHSRYYGGMKTRPFLKQMELKPEKAVLLTVKGMLPKTKHGRKLLTRLRVFAGAEHNLQGQKPAEVK